MLTMRKGSVMHISLIVIAAVAATIFEAAGK